MGRNSLSLLLLSTPEIKALGCFLNNFVSKQNKDLGLPAYDIQDSEVSSSALSNAEGSKSLFCSDPKLFNKNICVP